MVLTPFALALLLLPALLYYLSAWQANLATWALVVGVATLALIVHDNWLSRRRVTLELERLVDDKLSLGADNTVRIAVRSRSAAGARLSVKDDPPVEFVTSRRTQNLLLAPFDQAQLLYTTRPLNRGRYRFGDLHVRGRSQLGLSYWQRRYPAPREVSVYPNLLEVGRYQYLARADRLRQAGFRAVRRLGEGTEFESLRDYTPDDEFRSIDWKATARRGRPTSRQYEIERSQTVIDRQIDGGVEAQATLVGADRQAVLDAVATVHLHVAMVVDPGDAEHDRSTC